jgi:hypothetical protein
MIRDLSAAAGIIVVIAILCGFGSLATRTPGSDVVQQFAPQQFRDYTAHKGSRTISTTDKAAIKFVTTASGVTLKLNGTGTAKAVTANTEETLWIHPNVSSVVFYVASSAFASPTTIKTQLQ